MRHIFQRYASDCFPTCIAMIAGLSHAKALKLVHPIRYKGQSYETSDSRAVRVLRELGFKVRKRYIKDFTKLKQLAILALKVEGANFGHVVVWDPKSKRILNPTYKHNQHSYADYSKRLEYAFIISLGKCKRGKK